MRCLECGSKECCGGEMQSDIDHLEEIYNTERLAHNKTKKQLAEMQRAIQWSYDEGDCSVLNKFLEEMQ